MIKDNPYQAGGALSSNSLVYVQRQADLETVAHLRRMDYLLLIEPRQQGKTSLIMHLQSYWSKREYEIVYVSAEDLDYSDQKAWYSDFWSELIWKLPEAESFAFVPTAQGWRNGLRFLAKQAHMNGKRFVLALDEIGSLAKVEWAESFFAPMRKLFNERNHDPALNHLAFILSGAFSPQELIADDRISPFNVAHRVRLRDFSLSETKQLLTHLGLQKEQTDRLTQRIQKWVNGQPYLTQLLCIYLLQTDPDVDVQHVDEAIQRLKIEDENHLLPLFARIQASPNLLSYAQRINVGEKLKFNLHNPRHRQLKLFGLIRPDNEGYCAIRNQIYEQTLSAIEYDKERETTKSKEIDQNRLYSFINHHFNLEELKSLCFEMRVDYDGLSGSEKHSKVRELIVFFERHERLPELIAHVSRLRPNFSGQEL